MLARFDKIKSRVDINDRGVNLNDVLTAFGGAQGDLRIKLDETTVTCVFPSKGSEEKITLPLYEDKISGIYHFFAVLPIEVLHHDERINPRAIGANLRGLVEEFHKGPPQL